MLKIIWFFVLLGFVLNNICADELRVLIKPNIIQKLKPNRESRSLEEMRKAQQRNQVYKKKHLKHGHRSQSKTKRFFFKHEKR